MLLPHRQNPSGNSLSLVRLLDKLNSILTSGETDIRPGLDNTQKHFSVIPIASKQQQHSDYCY